MKILICTENLRMDGVKRAATTIGNQLAKDFTVFYYSLSQEKSFFYLAAPLIVSNPPVTYEGSFRGNKPLLRFKKQISDLIFVLKSNNFDLVIVTAGLLTSFIPQIKRKIPNIRVIAWMHNNYETYLNNYYQFMKDEFILGLGAADKVVVLTNHDLNRFLVHQNKTIKIYNPITIETNMASELTRPIISAVSRIDINQKGLDLLLQVAERLPQEWKIRLAGDGPDYKALQQSVKELQLASKLELVGSLTDKSLRRHYQESSIFLMTSRWEGMPLVIGEAMSFGLPVISMENTGAYEYLMDNKFGIMTDDHSVDALYKQLGGLIGSQERRNYWSKKSRRRIKDFSLSTITKQWLKVIENIY